MNSQWKEHQKDSFLLTNIREKTTEIETFILGETKNIYASPGCILGSKEVGVKFNKYLSMRTIPHQQYHTQTNTNQLLKYHFSSNPSL